MAKGETLTLTNIIPVSQIDEGIGDEFKRFEFLEELVFQSHGRNEYVDEVVVINGKECLKRKTTIRPR